VYIADKNNNRIRKVTVSTDIITTIAGTGAQSYSGDGGAATSAALYFPYGVALDASGTTYLQYSNYIRPQRNSLLLYSLLGNVYFSDSSNHRVRKITVSTDIITTIAGTGTTSYSGDNADATSATLNTPYGIALDSLGNHYYIALIFSR